MYWDMISRKMRDNMKGSKGMPLGVQVACLPFEEEKCMSLMRQLEEKVKFIENNKFPV